MKGKIYIIGLGPGNKDNMTVRALNAIEKCDFICGYSAYIKLIKDMIQDKRVMISSMGGERERCEAAINQALSGTIAGIVCSGDSSLYGMAGLLIELIYHNKVEDLIDVEVIPGITSALAASSLLGAPIAEDFCTISLSDYMIDFDKILDRIKAACEGDFTIALYNPKSSKRPDYLRKALKVISFYRESNTPVGIVKNGYREGQWVSVTTLDGVKDEDIDMFTTLIIGNSKSRNFGSFMVTSRGYKI